MKKLVMALGLIAAVFAAPSDAKAERYAHKSNVLVVQTRSGPVYYQPKQHHNWQQHHRRQEAKWHKKHQAVKKQEQCRNDSRRDYRHRPIVWYW